MSKILTWEEFLKMENPIKHKKYELFDEEFDNMEEVKKYIKKNIEKLLDNEYGSMEFLNYDVWASDIFDLYNDEIKNDIIKKYTEKLIEEELVINDVA